MHSRVSFCISICYNGGVNLTGGFGGYWFTIVLFQMYLCYLVLSIVSRLIHIDIVIPALIGLSLLGILALVIYTRDSWLWEFLCWENLTKYLQFFTLGIITSKYRNQFFKLLENNKFITSVIVGWIICMILWYNPAFKRSLPYLYSFIHDLAVRYFALMTIVVAFYSNRERLAGVSNWSKTLRFIGQRTLDIYMLHYFFIPNLRFLDTWMQHGNMIAVQLIIGVGLTLVITSLCIVISSILRKSEFLESWLFGVKRRVIA